MTDFAFTPPIAHLRDFEPYQDFTFALSFLLDNPTYLDWLDQRDSPLTIMDNSFNETQIPATIDEVIELYQLGLADVVVQPDADNWSSDQMLAAYCGVRQVLGSHQVMGIFRNEKERLALEREGALYTAVSYWWRRDWPPYSNFTQTHFLGLGALGRFKPKTLDTTIPIKMAIKGQDLADWDGTYKMPSPTDLRSENRLARAWAYFHTVMTDNQLELAVHNIAVLRDRFDALGQDSHH